jgi:hypothetical protein
MVRERSMKTSELKSIFNSMFTRIGKKTNSDVKWYLNDRPKIISRNSFFEATVWAIWVSGMSRKSADSFLKHAAKNGFDWDYRTIASQDIKDFLRFAARLHGSPVPNRALKKWLAVRHVAVMLSKHSSENDFRKKLFSGKIKSASLNNENVQELFNLRIPFIGKANSHFIIRNMGGEAIKCDRWVKRFLSHYALTQKHLENKLRKLEIPLGLFDVVLWVFCERFVNNISKFAKSFNRN